MNLFWGGPLIDSRTHCKKRQVPEDRLRFIHIPMAALDYLLSSYRFARADNEIWVAEDNTDVRFFLSRAFRSNDPSINLIFFRNGAELVEHFHFHSALPRLILLDMEMPVMDGLEALSSIGSCPKAPVVIFSSLENPEIIRRAYCFGAKLYLKKPPGLKGFGEVAELCINWSEAIGALPAGQVPFTALDAREALDFIAVGTRMAIEESVQDRARSPRCLIS